ncbi:MAG TPA: NAD(P)/FAD-dependent oxidoreductase [Anaerolineae bacterium]|nr:NAD(P)/FAD-dependent oxidoreductase [Anaerolineae bacterium]
MKSRYDVVVIGAGPAGSIAARTAAEAGLETLLIEKRQEIGSPVRCGEAVGRDTTEKFIPLDPKWIAAEIDCFSIYNVQGDHVVMPPLERTLVLERKIFDRELAHSAAKAGAEVVVKARATGLIRNGGGIEGVRLVVQGEPHEVHATVVIGADGTESQTPRWAGLKSIPQLKNYYTAAQYLMTDIDVNPRICQYHIGWSIAPGGYCWVFPKGDQQANVGLVMWVDPKETKTAIEYLNEFVAARFPGKSILAQVVGGIPITNVLPEMVTDGYLAVGDAAHQSDPLTAGGITNGMYGGLFAAQVAAEGIKKDDVSKKFLKKYEQMWDAEFGKLYRRLLRIRHAVLNVPDDKLGKMIAEASKLDTQMMSLKDIAMIVLKSHPKLLLEAVPYFLGQ